MSGAMGRKRAKTGKIRLTEVAKLAGVSPITASRFFRTPEALSAERRVRVESAANELGYVPNLAARALASQRTEVIGVLIPSLTNNVFSDVLRGIYDALDGSRYSIQLANTRYSILQEERLLRLFLAQKPAGLIVTGINQTPDSRVILEGYRAAMNEAGLFNERLIVTTAVPTSMTLGGTLFADLLAKAPDIDAVFCVNDDLALGALFECKRRHMAVPDQMAIVGFNDLEFMASSVPTLTSVRTNRYEMGRNAAQMVIETLEGRRPEQGVVDLGFSIVQRESSKRA
jgi:DNA-binding LacI/PurR family transcriptional regulator